MKINKGFTPLDLSVNPKRPNKGLRGFTPLERRPKAKVTTAFTLIELMLVVIIIGILAAMVVPRLGGRSEEARVAAAKADIEANLSLAIDLYEMDNGAYPRTLDNLITKSSEATSWKGPYIKKKPLDPWGREYVYQAPGMHNPTSYDIYSMGRDGQSGTADDVTNWQ